MQSPEKRSIAPEEAFQRTKHLFHTWLRHLIRLYTKYCHPDAAYSNIGELKMNKITSFIQFLFHEAFISRNGFCFTVQDVNTAVDDFCYSVHFPFPIQGDRKSSASFVGFHHFCQNLFADGLFTSDIPALLALEVFTKHSKPFSFSLSHLIAYSTWILHKKHLVEGMIEHEYLAIHYEIFFRARQLCRLSRTLTDSGGAVSKRKFDEQLDLLRRGSRLISETAFRDSNIYESEEDLEAYKQRALAMPLSFTGIGPICEEIRQLNHTITTTKDLEAQVTGVLELIGLICGFQQWEEMEAVRRDQNLQQLRRTLRCSGMEE